MMGTSVSSPTRKAGRAAAWAAAAVLILGVPTARAQSIFYAFEPAPQRIERQLEAAGFELRGPLVRRGDVYVCDVLGPAGNPARLVIDAGTGQILERYAARPGHWREARLGEWREPDLDGDWREREGPNGWDGPPLTPPYGILQHQSNAARTNADNDYAPPPRQQRRDQTARLDPNAPSAIIPGNNGTGASTSVDVDQPKPKPHVVKRKPAPAKIAPAAPAAVEATAPAPTSMPAGRPAETESPAAVTAPANAPVVEAPKPLSPANDATASPSVRTDLPKPVAEAKPVAAAKPAIEAKPDPAVKTLIESKPVVMPKPIPESKPVAEASPVATAKAPSTPAPRPTGKPKRLNDLPVTPLD